MKQLQEIVMIFEDMAERTGADFETVVKMAKDMGIFKVTNRT